MGLPSLINPASKGSVTATSADLLTYPRIETNYLSEQVDVDTLVFGLKLLRQIVQTAPMSSVLGKEVVNHELPGAEDPTSKEYMEAYVRSGATTVYHPVGTCSIGSVADASVMPRIPAGNTNWPSIMVGEKAASMIRSS